jgi:non-ribosomal peptide synthetase component F
VTFDDKSLTYQQLNRQANQLAHHLQALGVGPEVLVGIYVERSLEMVVGLLGILKAGGAYVPCDPAYPQERLAFISTGCPGTVLLTQQPLTAGLTGHRYRLFAWTQTGLIAQEATRILSKRRPDNLVYVIYTLVHGSFPRELP